MGQKVYLSIYACMHVSRDLKAIKVAGLKGGLDVENSYEKKEYILKENDNYKAIFLVII